MDEIEKLYKELTGQELNEKQKEGIKKISDEARNALKKALSTLKEYTNEFPQDVNKAITTLAVAAGYGYPAYGTETGSEEGGEEKETQKKDVNEESEKPTLEKAIDKMVSQVEKFDGRFSELEERLASLEKQKDKTEDKAKADSKDEEPKEDELSLTRAELDEVISQAISEALE